MSEDFKIEKGIPIPSIGKPLRSKYRAAIESMEVGDSFHLPVEKGDSLTAVRNRCITAAHNALGKGSIATRTEGDGLRLWRIK